MKINICLCGTKITTPRKFFCSDSCRKKWTKIRNTIRECSDDQIHINDSLSRRWELLWKLAKEDTKSLMNIIEQKFPLSYTVSIGENKDIL